MRAAGLVAIFEEVLRLGRPARADVDREHRLDVGGLAPVHEFVGAELVGLGRAPGEIEPDGALVLGADAVFPIIARGELAARIAHERGHQLAECGWTRGRRVGGVTGGRKGWSWGVEGNIYKQ